MLIMAQSVKAQVFKSLLGKNWRFAAEVAGSRQYLRHNRIKMHKDKSGEFYCRAFYVGDTCTA